MDKDKKVIDRDSLYDEIKFQDNEAYNDKIFRRQEFDKKKRNKKNY